MGFNFGSGSGSAFAPKPATTTTTPADSSKDDSESSAAETATATDKDDGGATPSAGDNEDAGKVLQGEGEENEETLGKELRAKLYLFVTTPATDDAPQKTEWKDHGIAIFKVKRNTETGKIRLLGRNEANGRVVMVRNPLSVMLSQFAS